MDQQTIFNKALYGIRVQGAPSMTGTLCAYRSPAGACGIGLLIADQDYHPDFDRASTTASGTGVSELLDDPSSLGDRFRQALCSAGVAVGDWSTQDLLKAIQQAHDLAAHAARSESEFLLRFEGGMRRVSQEFDLDYPEAQPC